MKSTVWSFRTFAALWGILLGPLLPLHAGEADIAALLPADTLAYAGWARLVDEDDPEAAQIKALVGRAARGTFDDPDLQNLALFMELLGLAADKPGGIALLDLTVADETPDVQVALVIVAGDDAPRLAQSFARLIQGLQPAAEPREQAVAGVGMHALPLGDTPLTILWGSHKGHFLLTLGETAAGRIIERVNGAGSSLADSDELKFARRKVRAGPGDAVFSGYGDVRAIVAKAKSLAEELSGPLPPLVEPLLEALGINAIHSKYIHCSKTEQGSWWRIFVHVEGERKGILKLWDQEPLSEDDLRIVPEDAYWAQVWNLDLADLWQELLVTVEAVDPEMVPMIQGAVAMTAGFLGFSVTDDLLPALGDTWAVYDAPAHGGVLLTGSVLVAEVKDSEAVHGTLLRLVEMLKPVLRMKDVNLATRQASDGDHTIHHVVIGGVPCPVAPAWGFVGDRMVFGLFPQTVKVALDQVDPQTRQASILDHPGFQNAKPRIFSDSIQSFGFCDSQYFARLFYPLGLMYSTAGCSMLSVADVDLDFSAFPLVAEVVERAHNTFGTCSTDKDGILYAQVGTGTTAVAAVAVVALLVSILLPSLARARELAKRAVSSANLRGIGMGIHIYANDHQERFPESLDELVEAGYITREMLTSPRDREGAVSYIYLSGQSAAADARNIVAYERVIGDEGTNVLFSDGHVEWMKLDAFKRALQATYERLGRADEMPGELRP
jgi:prepilin-type processing-associated H-X9-DG protein